MNVQFNLSLQTKHRFNNHLKPNLLIDPDRNTLDEAAQLLAIDRPEDEPLIVWLTEDINSAIAVPGKTSLYWHDCMHAILNLSQSPADEAYLSGFFMGNVITSHELHQRWFKFVASVLYPEKYRLPPKVFHCFDRGFLYGRSLPVKNLNQVDFRDYQNDTVAQVRQRLEVFPEPENARLSQ